MKVYKRNPPVDGAPTLAVAYTQDDRYYASRASPGRRQTWYFTDVCWELMVPGRYVAAGTVFMVTPSDTRPNGVPDKPIEVPAGWSRLGDDRPMELQTVWVKGLDRPSRLFEGKWLTPDICTVDATCTQLDDIWTKCVKPVMPAPIS